MLEQIAQITKQPRHSLQLSQRGARANAPRRFAIWALAENTQLSYREIADQFGTSRAQIGNIISALRRSMPPPMRPWADQLAMRREERFGGF